ncbi:MAG: ADOP family duplicated permease [Vicinamibacterales bacterium]
MKGRTAFADGLARHRALIRIFFARFFESDLVGGAHDLKTAFFALLAFLSAPGALIPALIAQHSSIRPGKGNWGSSMIARYDSVDALRALTLTDKTLYLGCGLAVTGIVTTLMWNSLLPERRDALVLGPLPVRPATVVRARLVALAGYIAMVSVAMHALASLSFGLFLAEGNTFGFALRGIAAHFAASCAASAFVFLAIVSVQALVVAIAGPRVFSRVSPILQVTLVALTVALLLALPTISQSAASTLGRTPGLSRPWILWTPALWFLGLYESILGTTDPMLGQLSWFAAAALGTVLVVTVGTYPLVYRRLTTSALETGGGKRRHRAARLPQMVAASISRNPRVRAISEFLLVTIGRSDLHRLIVAASVGLTVAWGAAAVIALTPAGMRTPPPAVLAIPLSALVFLLVGFRLAIAIPVEAACAWVFEVRHPTRSEVRQAVWRTMVFLVVLPVILLSTTAYWRWWGTAFALTHAAFLSSIAALMLEVLLWRFDGVPCAQPWRPERAQLGRLWPAYVAGFVAFTSGAAVVELILATLLLAPGSMGPLVGPRVIYYLVPTFIGMVLGIAALVRRAAASKEPGPDEGNLEILTDALRGAAEVHARPLKRGPPVLEDDPARHVGVAGSFLDPVRTSVEHDPWYGGLSLRPDHLWRDLRHASRRLGRAPMFTLLSVLSLALGIGATTTMYSLAQAVLLRPMQIRDADRVVTISRRNGTGDALLSWLDFEDVRSAETTFAAVEASNSFPTSLTGRDMTTMVDGMVVTGGYFQLLGVDAAVGRVLQPSDDRPDAPPTVLISDMTWRTRFGADPDIVGTAIHVGDGAYAVVGVLPSSFRGIHVRVRQPAVWMPMAHAPLTGPAAAAHRDASRREQAFLNVLARLLPAGTEAAARSQVQGLAATLDADVPLPATAGQVGARRRLWDVTSISRYAWGAQSRSARIVVMVLPAIVLLVACTNLANLVLSRGAARTRDLAIRRALGASRWTLVRGQLVEHGLVAVGGGLAGIALARIGITYVTSFVQLAMGYAPEYQIDPRIDLAVIGATTVAVVLALVVTGLAPAIQLTRAGTGRVLRANTGVGGSPRWRGRAHLITLQVAASVALLLVAALCVRAVVADARPTQPYIDARNVAAMDVALSLRTHDEAHAQAIVIAVIDTARRTVGIQGVAAVTGIPGAGGAGMGVYTTTPGRPFNREGKERPAALNAVTGDTFAVLGLRLLAGRSFDEADGVAAAPVAVVSDAQARQLFGETSPIGRQLMLSDSGSFERTATIVGIVADAGINSDGRPRRDVYVPFAQRPAPSLNMLQFPVTLLARAGSGGVSLAATTLRSAVAQADRDLAVVFIGPAESHFGSTATLLALVAQVAGALALVSLLLSMAGLYGVVSHVVVARTREMGIRIALGADRRRILRLVFSDGARPVVKGIVIGLVVATITRMAMQSLFQRSVSAFDSMAVVLAITPLLVAASLACYLPARRAARLNPSTAIRDAD